MGRCRGSGRRSRSSVRGGGRRRGRGSTFSNLRARLRRVRCRSESAAGNTKTHMPATKVLASLGLLAATTNALDNGQGLTPQMGYSSWNDCASAVTEEHIKATASYMISSGLAVRATIGSSQSQGSCRGLAVLVWSDACGGYAVAVVVRPRFD